MKAMAEKGRSTARKLTVGILPCKGRAWAKNRQNCGRFARSVKAVILTIFGLPALNLRDGFCPRFRRETEHEYRGPGNNHVPLRSPHRGFEYPERQSHPIWGPIPDTRIAQICNRAGKRRCPLLQRSARHDRAWRSITGSTRLHGASLPPHLIRPSKAILVALATVSTFRCSRPIP